MSNASRFIKSSAIYFAGNVLTKIIAFLLLPLFTNFIAPNDMGYYNISVAYLNMLIPVISLEIWSAIMRFMYDYSETNKKYKPIVNGLSIFIGSMIIYSLMFVVFAFTIDVKFIWYVYFYGILTILHNIYTSIARGLGFNKVFAVSGIIGSIANSASNIIMILVFHMRLESLYIATLIGLVVQLIIIESKVKVIKNFKIKLIDKKMIKSMIKFGLPLALNSACFWFLTNYNQVAITNILGLEANGLYGIGAKFSVALTLITTCFSLAWQELVYSKGNEKGKGDFYTKAINYYIKFLMFGMLIFVPAIKVVFPFFIGADYQGAFPYVPIYLLATAAGIISGFLGNIFAAEKKTGVIFLSTVAAAVVNVSVLHLLINVMGMQAANISLLLGFLVNIAMRIILIKSTAVIKIDFITLIFTSALFAVGLWVYFNLGTGYNILFAVGASIIAIFFFKDLIKQLFATIKRR